MYIENCLRITLVLALFQRALAIDCYVCSSVDGSNSDCDDDFKRDISTVYLIKRRCMYKFFPGNFCIKLKGERADGTLITVRQCTAKHWGKHCGDIKYNEGGIQERLTGCLKTCDHDGCNGSESLYHADKTIFLLLPLLVQRFFIAIE